MPINVEAEREQIEHLTKAALNGHRERERIPFKSPPFPVDALPPWLADFCTRAAASYPVPVEMVAMPVMVALGSLMGSRVRAYINPLWQEYPCLWLIAIAESGYMKSPPMKLAKLPIVEMQKEADKTFAFAMKSYEAEMTRRKTEKGYHGEEPTKPVARSYYTTDTTMEALIWDLQHTPGILISADEIIGWVRRMNQYRKGGDRQHYMQIHSGESLRFNRKSTGPINVDHPLVGVTGTIQPSVVPGLSGGIEQEDGFLFRIIPMIPDMPPKLYQRSSVSEVDVSDLLAFYQMVDAIPYAGEGTPNDIPIIGKTEDLWETWVNQNSHEATKRGGPIASSYMKLEACCMRLAVILHVAKDPTLSTRAMSVSTLREAIEILEWIRPQVHEFIHMLQMGNPSEIPPPKGVGLWSRIVRQYEKLSECRIVEVSENGKTSDTWVSVRKMQHNLSVTREELTNELDSHHDLATVRNVPGGRKDQFEVSIRLSENYEDSDSPTVRQSDSLVVSDPNPPPF